MPPSTPPPSLAVPDSIPLGAAARVWARIGLLSFGGPAAQVALMHQELVEKRKWVDEARFLHALNYCMLLPGPEAQQLATYIGWLMHKTRGGLLAGTLFVLPGTLVLLSLSVVYAGFRELPAVAAAFFGLKAAVLAVVVEAVLRIGRRALKSRVLVGLAVAAFVAIFFFTVSFPLIILAASLLGWMGGRLLPLSFPLPPPPQPGAAPSVIEGMASRGELAHTQPSWSRAFGVVVVCGILWVTPLLVLVQVFGRDSVYVAEGVFFSKAAVVTFGGAYAVLAYIAQQAVDVYGWLRPGEMLDGLGLAETTPGPLILVVQFVAFLGAFREPGTLPPLLAGVLGSLVTVWVTFVPCFLWIFLGAPWIEALRGNRALHTALSGITAAVVGVVLNLSLWFALHVVFAVVEERRYGPLRVLIPDVSSVDEAATVLALGAMVAMFRFHWPLARTLLVSAVLGCAWKFWG